MEAPRSLSGPRRHRRARQFARGLCLGALTLALLGPAAAPAGAVAGPGVFVAGPDVAVSEAQIKAAAESERVREYILRAAPGEAGQRVPRQGVPVRKVLEMAQVSLGDGYLTIPRTNGTVAYLPEEDFEEPSPVFEEGKPAVISTDSGSTRFFRPVIGSGANAEDNIATPSGEALTIGVHSGHVVEVTVTPSTTSTTAGSPVTFTAAVVGGGAFDFTWTFGDGGTADGAEVSHSFSGSGTYLVRATATGTGGDESGGESGPVAVVVGDPPTTDAPGASATPPPPKVKPTGSPGKGREGRGGKGSKSTPSGGQKSKKGSTAAGDSSAQRGDSPAGRTRASEPAESLPPSAAMPAPEPSTVPPPTPVEPEGSTHPSPPAGELVEGRLVGDNLGPATIAEAVGGSAEGEGSRSAPGAVDKGGVGLPVVALIVVALLAGGALFEWRRSRPTV